MRAVIQRVRSASVTINGKITASIGEGMLILLGLEENDSQQDIDWLSGKISRLRIFEDENGIMNLSVKDVDKEVLIVSQFTLHASTRKGNRPSYIRAASPDVAIPLYEDFIRKMETDIGRRIRQGVFGAMMDISLVNNGPVTIIIDTRLRE